VNVRVAASFADIDAAAWNALPGADAPFLRHEFLLALEASGCATPATGWKGCHLLLEDGGRLAGAMPLYLKSHSWGGFVFDFAWADAYRRAGLAYYPRLVSAVPFTPATGSRLLAAGEDRDRLLGAARAILNDAGLSSLHVLFPDAEDRAFLEGAGLLPRLDCQFHWRNEGYATFGDFLDGFTAEKRKKLRRERRRVAESGLACRTLTGAMLDERLLDVIHGLHAVTFARHGNPPYLNRDCFGRIAEAMPEALVVEVAELAGETVACSISLRGKDTLYGRYWGASGDFHSLHFELCYYRGIEYCIRERLSRFEPGTQGEHKLLRGFLPTPVWSMHEIADPFCASAIADWLGEERALREAAFGDAARHLPFRRADIPARLDPDVRNRMAPED
jgi:predicted N-acyltransferase